MEAAEPEHGSFPGETHDLPTATWVTLLVNMLVFVALALILSSLGFAGVAAARAYAGY